MREGRTGSAKISEKWHSLAKANAIGVDNTNENIGTRNSIKTRGLAKNKEIVIAGWTCHILHIVAGKAADAFAETSRFDVEDHCVYIFYWFDKLWKWKFVLK